MHRPRSLTSLGWALGAAVIVASVAGHLHAQVPPDIAAGLKEIGPIVDPACTAKLYRPLMPANDIRSSVTPLYPGTTIARDVSFGPHRKDVVDIFTADEGPASRPVLIYVAGGAGNKIEIQAREANAFYDNIMRWATKHGMVGVNMQRHQGDAWDDGGRDVSRMIQWLQANIGRYRGNPDRMFIMAHSAGNGPLGTYVGRPELYGPKGVGVKGAVFLSGQFNVAPLEIPGGGFRGRGGRGADPLAGAGSTCGAPGGAGSSAGAAGAAGAAAGSIPTRSSRGRACRVSRPPRRS